MMSGNSNTEPDAGGGGGTRGPALCMAAAAVAGVLGLWWQNRKAMKQIQENMEVMVKRNSLYIQHSQRTSFLESYSNFHFSPDAREKIKKGSDLTRMVLTILSELDDLEGLLVERQHLFCSYFTPKSHRELVEEKIREKTKFLAPWVGIKKEDLDKILYEDRHCASCLSYLLTGDKSRNGGLMWEMLKGWRNGVKEHIKDTVFRNVHEDDKTFWSRFLR